MTGETHNLPNAFRFLRGRVMLGQLAVLNGFITPPQLDTCLDEQRVSAEPRPLAQILIARGFLKAEQLAELLRQQKQADAEPVEGDGRTLGRYVLADKLGEGGAGVVWRAWDAQLERWVAIKEPRLGDAHARERFMREARAAAKVRHPHLVEVHEVGEEHGRPFLIMNFVEGRPLDEAKPEPAAAAILMADVCDAVHATHAAGIVHRDIKPQNILVDGSGRGFLGDFGLARDVASRPLTVEGRLVGTPVYMAPEQVQGKQEAVGPQTDVYGLGATLYHAITGRAPFAGVEDYATLFHHILNLRPAAPRTIDPALAADLEAVILHAMEKRPEDRYANAAEMAEDLRRFARREPVVARPPGVVRRSVSWVDRNFRFAAALFVAAVAVGVVASVLLWELGTEGRDRQFDLLCHEGRELLDRGRPADALVKLEAAERLQPSRPLPWLIQGRCRLLMGDGDEAERCWQRALTIDPAFRSAVVDLGKYYVSVYVQRRLPPPARVSAGRVTFARLPEETEADRAWRERGERRLEEARAMKGVDSLELAYVQGALAFGRREHATAARLVNDYVRANPVDIPALTLLAAARYLAGDFAEAEEALSRAIALEPRPGRHRARGDVRFCLRRFAEAADDYGRAGDDADAVCNRGLALQAIDRRVEAIDAFDRAIAMRPRFARAHNCRGIARFEGGDSDGALADFETAGDFEPHSAEAHHNRGNVWMARKEYREAMYAYDEAIASEPGFADAHVDRAVALLRLGNAAGAVAGLEEALRRRPDYERALVELALALRGSDDARALTLVKRALEVAPADWAQRSFAEQLAREWSR